MMQQVSLCAHITPQEDRVKRRIELQRQVEEEERKIREQKQKEAAREAELRRTSMVIDARLQGRAAIASIEEEKRKEEQEKLEREQILGRGKSRPRLAFGMGGK